MRLQLAKASWVAPLAGAVAYGIYGNTPDTTRKSILLGAFLALSAAGFVCGLAAVFMKKREGEANAGKHAVVGIGCSSFLVLPALAGLVLGLLGVSGNREMLAKSEAMLREGRSQDAISFLDARLSAVERGTESRPEARAFLLLGVAQRNVGEREAAQASLERSLAALERHGARPDMEPVLDQLGVIAIEREDLVTAEALLIRAWEIHESTKSTYSLTANNLATVRSLQGRHAEAIPLLRSSIASAEANPEGRARLPELRRNLIDTLRLAGREDEARQHESDWNLTGTPGLSRGGSGP